jgi:hypothetical protein
MRSSTPVSLSPNAMPAGGKGAWPQGRTGPENPADRFIAESRPLEARQICPMTRAPTCATQMKKGRQIVHHH